MLQGAWVWQIHHPLQFPGPLVPVSCLVRDPPDGSGVSSRISSSHFADGETEAGGAGCPGMGPSWGGHCWDASTSGGRQP